LRRTRDEHTPLLQENRETVGEYTDIAGHSQY
jgi:hypothetical protein